jgi:hypothetical protein
MQTLLHLVHVALEDTAAIFTPDPSISSSSIGRAAAEAAAHTRRTTQAQNVLSVQVLLLLVLAVVHQIASSLFVYNCTE